MSRLSGISRAGPLCCSASEVEREESVVGRILNTSLRSSKCNIYSTLYNDIIYYPFSFSLSVPLSCTKPHQRLPDLRASLKELRLSHIGIATDLQTGHNWQRLLLQHKRVPRYQDVVPCQDIVNDRL